ncbi:diguanylate cyclase/phosphodiesterase (GGDEF & EAL domains) with PAS/PAC sensor(s) [Acidisarcina polymorpha]|uniref:histidine kinase n=1 Tax=Acidisarcina polymorpha TaxID=2211140 RepID=A0A2Z5FWX2_9BACT|nr:diguanylate cyclase/phosphodiesterase (GGDEF & EAL domains) with PAS/PAC sensor(s) [Acidisarcina polymorpha]
MLLIGLVSYITLRSTRLAEEDSDWVVHTQAVQKTLQSALGDAVDTLSGGRGFALTGQETFLDAEARSERRLDRDLDTLRQLTVDNADQQKRLVRLQAEVNAAVESTLRIEAARQRTGNVPSDGEVIESKRYMDAVRATIGEMQDEEARLLAQRIARAQEARRWIQFAVWSSALIGMGFLTLFGILLRREIDRGASMEAQLRTLNADLELQYAESRRAEAEARSSELRLLGAAESSMDCLYFCEAVRGASGEIEDFVFTYVNSNAVNLVAFSREELIGARMCELFPMNLKLGLFEKYRRIVLTGETFVGEFMIEEETIKTAWLRIQAVKLADGVAITASDITERKRHEEATRKSKALLERTEQLTDTGGWELDLVTGELFWSAEVYRILGVAPDHRPVLEEGIQFYVPEDRIRVRAAIETAIAGGDGWDMECTVVTTNGEQVPVRVVGEAEFDNGKPIRLTGAFKDITQRVAERLALQTVKDRLALATDSGGIGIWDWDISNDKLTWDPWMYRLYGMDPRDEDVVYEVWRQHVHPDDLSGAERQLQEAMDGVRAFNTEFRVVWDDESVHHIHGTGHVTRDEAGRPVRMVGTNWDVTAQKQLEAEGRQAERSLREQALIIDMAEDTVFIRDGKDRVTYWNQGAQRLYGWSKEEALGHVTYVLLKTKFPQPLADIKAQLLSQGYWNGELVHTRRDGSLVTVVSSWTNRHDEITGEVSVLEINHDITARKTAEEELARNRREIERGSIRLRAVNKELEQFAYAASHDLKAPLRVIDNASQWLEEDLAEHLTTETRETMRLLRGRVQRMGKLLDDLLDYARIGRELDNRPSEVIAGDVLINDVLALLPTSNFTITVSPCFSNIQLTRMPLQQILSNLIGNAIKHHDKPQGRIEVTVSECGDFYEFAVHDDGPGIPAQFHEQIFKMFQTLRPRDQVEGSGMGLALARKTVESYGGELRVESAEGQGCTFRFNWPKDQRSGREAWSGEDLDNT